MIETEKIRELLIKQKKDKDQRTLETEREKQRDRHTERKTDRQTDRDKKRGGERDKSLLKHTHTQAHSPSPVYWGSFILMSARSL